MFCKSIVGKATPVLVFALVAASSFAAADPIPAAATTGTANVNVRPNILIIVTDDQPADTLAVMQAVRKRFVQGGKKFTNAFAVTPQCCPSRASILTGRYPHNHGVFRNGEARNLDQRTTIEHYLHGAGYRTAIAGKFLNGWLPPDAPPHFDDYSVLFPTDLSSYGHSQVENDGYYNALFNNGGVIEHVPDYSTDYIAGTGIRFIEEFEATDDRPWFLYLAPYGPHTPSTPEPEYADAPVPAWDKHPSFGERNVSDKPPWVRRKDVSLGLVEGLHARQHRSLMSVDDLVDDVFTTLDRLDETRDTLAIFMSDNGLLMGEHGLLHKRYPYTESIQIPMLMRWPGHVERHSRDNRLVATIDVVPTILRAVRIQADEDVPIDGKSLLGRTARQFLFLEFFDWEEVPSWISLRTADEQLIHYYSAGGERIYQELYDLADDPWQLRNQLAGNFGSTPDRFADLADRMLEAQSCSGASCP